MKEWFFVSDMHGRPGRYQALFQAIRETVPPVVLIGGDLLPSGFRNWEDSQKSGGGFLSDYLVPELSQLQNDLGKDYPRFLIILGNDDGRFDETKLVEYSKKGIWTYIHNMSATIDVFSVYGYSFVPPTPFLLKDWERYDVSYYTDPGCIPPDQGYRSFPVDEHEIRHATIRTDLENLSRGFSPDHSIFLFHSPPYQTNLDRAALDGKMIDTAPLDVHVGSIAIRKFIESHQPLLTCHGHIHESAGITGNWKDRIGRTIMLSAAHDGPELALIRFHPADPSGARRELIP